MSYNPDDFMSVVMRFYDQCTESEKAFFLITLESFAKAKSAEAQTQCLAEFKDWYLKRRGLPLDTPQRGDRA